MIESKHLRGLVADPARWLDPLNAACAEFGIESPEHLAMFLAHCSHETAKFTRMRESMSYSAERILKVWPTRFRTLAEAAPYARNPEKLANRVYARRDLGNGPEASGDGFKFRGGGSPMLTGRALYTLASGPLGVDLVNRPQDIIDPLTACRAGGWFWRYKKVGKFADSGDLRGSRKAWNGGYIGLREVRELYDIARPNFGLEAQE